MTINGLTAKIIEKKGKKAEVEIEGQRLIIPSSELPLQAKLGDEVRLYFICGSDAKISEKNLAKIILEEILNGK